LVRFAVENLLFFAALLCKESALPLPATAFLVQALLRKEKSALFAAARLLPAAVLYLGLRQHALGALTYDPSLGYFVAEPTLVRALTVLSAAPRYVQLLVFPTTLSADYSREAIPDAHGFGPSVLLGGAIVLGLLLLAWRGWRRRSPTAVVVAAGVAILVVQMAPYLHLVPIGFLLAERWLYLPSVGFVLVVGVAAVWLGERLRHRALVSALVGVLALWFVVRTADRNLDWRSRLSLLEATVEAVPKSAFAHGNLALSAYWAGQTKRAIEELGHALALSARAFPPLRQGFRTTLAKIHHDLGDHATEVAVLEAGMANPVDRPHLAAPFAAARAELGP
jgi:hypothetical protein